MFHRLRGGHVSDVQLNWPNGIKPVWQQTLPKSVFAGDTVPVHALLAGPVDGTLTLVGRLQTNSEPLDLATLTLLPNPEATDSEASTLARMVAWAQVKELANASATAPLRQRITQLAVTYQLVTDESCFVLVHQRADADKALDMPEQTRVKQMLAAGWGGTSSVTGRLESGSVHSIVRPRTSSSKSSARKLVAPAALQPIAKPMPRFENALRGQSHGFDAGDVFFSRGHCFGNMDSFDGDLLADLKNARHSNRADARLWASGVSYTGLTPLGLAQWLGQHPAADWPTDVDALAAVGVGQAVIDWIEFVLAVRWRVMAEGIPPVTALLCWLDKAQVRAFLSATLDASAAPVLPASDMATALGGITASMVDLHEKGLIDKLIDVQSFDSAAAASLARNPNHIEVSANQYANFGSKGASVERLDVVVLSALEIDTKFNVNVITGSDGIIRGASGGHSDTAAHARLAIIVAPLVRGRIPTVVENVLTTVTPGEHIDILVTDHGIAVNPKRPKLAERLHEAGIDTVRIEDLYQRAVMLTGRPDAIRFTDRPVAVIRYRDGSVIDAVYQIAANTES